jgi:predicted secreted protein
LQKAAPGYLRVHPVEEGDGWIRVGEEPKPPPPSSQPPVAAPRPAPTDGVLRMAPGTTFELRLPTAPNPGFLWRIETDGPAVAVVGQRSERGEHVVRLAARAPGTASVRCAYARPWDRQPAEVRTYEVVVDLGYS